MKIQLLSDLHNEHDSQPYSFRIPQTDADIIVLDGDIGVGKDAVYWSKKQQIRLNKPILQVFGNHEFYNNDFGLIETCRRLTSGSGVHILEANSIKIEDITFLGVTLWTDYLLYGPVGRLPAMAAANDFMSDHRLITRYKGLDKFSPYDAEEINQVCFKWLDTELKKTGRKVVITHHAPSGKCISPVFTGDDMSPAFSSDLEGFIMERNPEVWMYGHTHFNNDFMIGNTRVISNQRGYPREYVEGFNPSLVIEV